MKILISLLILLLSYAPVAIAEKNVLVEAAVHYYTTDETVTLSFNTVDNADDYEIFLYAIDRKEYNYRWIVTAEEGAATAQMQFQLPKSGFYKFQIRSRKRLNHSDSSGVTLAINSKTTKEELLAYMQSGCTIGDWWNESLTLDELKALAHQEEYVCSPFNDSTDGANSLVIDPESNETYNRGWVLYGYPAPPSGGGISIQ